MEIEQIEHATEKQEEDRKKATLQKKNAHSILSITQVES